MENTQIQLINETDLHNKVVAFIRRFYPDVIMIPGLGEYQTNTTIRTSCYNKGYTGGQPDIIIINSHRCYQGLAIELKSPTGKGKLSNKQNDYLNKLELSGYKCIISNDYEEIIVEMIKYFDDIMYPCKHCNKRGYKTIEKLNNHLKYFHKIEI
jgi:hypothetical protein